MRDTSSGQLRIAAQGRAARLYVCGITPYDATHLGHAATYLAFDLLARAWRDAGHEVQYVQNVTDVDEPLLERATATGQDWRALAARETDLFRQDMAALNALPPDAYIGAVEAVPSIAASVRSLLEAGAAYRVAGADGEPDGDVYFDVSADPHFGEVAGLDAATMRTLFGERGGDPDRPGKRHALDPLLWRVQRPDEPGWDGGLLGTGRPGWHVECTAIALEHLGMSFDVQGGGSDLAFPHHEMGAAHAHALTGSWPYARNYAHAGMVGLDGEKMSKSRGNLVLVSRLREQGVDPMAIRLALLQHHYASSWEWSGDDLTAAQDRLASWRRAVAAPAGPPAAPVLDAVRERLADDLDAPGALAVVDDWAQRVAAAGTAGGTAGGEGTAADPAAPAAIGRTVDALLGVRL